MRWIWRHRIRTEADEQDFEGGQPWSHATLAMWTNSDEVSLTLISILSVVEVHAMNELNFREAEEEC